MMFGTIKNLTAENVFSMNENNMEYLANYENSVEIDYRPILKEINNFSCLDNIYTSLNEVKKTFVLDEKYPEDFTLINHCLNSLKSVLLLTSKIIKSIETINNIKSIEKNKNKSILNTDLPILAALKDKNLTPCVNVYYDELLLTYFESLLIQSQGLMDKLSIYIQKYKIYDSNDEILLFETEKQKAINSGTITNESDFIITPGMKKKKNFYFSNLKDLIKQLSLNNPSDDTYKVFKIELNTNIPKLNDLIISNNQKSLRNKIVHEESVITLNDNVFVIYRTKKGKILKFDSPIIDGYPPIIEATDRILKSIPQMTINIISSIINEKYQKSLNVNNQLSFKFTNTLIDFRKYIIEQESLEDKIKLNKFELRQDGFTLQDFYYIKRKLFL